MTLIPGPEPRKKVAVFATCINEVMFPNTVNNTAVLLERLGCDVEFPRAQTCCGQMFTNTGYFDRALPSVRAFLEAFEEYDYIVGPSGSCVGSVREQHEMLALDAGEDELARRVHEVQKRVYDISEFIVDVLGTVDVGAYFPHTVTYHASCHSLRVAEVGDRPIRLLQAVRGLEYIPLEDMRQCCGFGGTFSVKNSDVSIALGRDKARHVLETGAEYVASLDNACLMNFGGILHREKKPVRPIHMVNLLVQTAPVGASAGAGALAGAAGTASVPGAATIPTGRIA